MQQQWRPYYYKKQFVPRLSKKSKSRHQKTPISGAKRWHHGSRKPAGRPKGKWPGHDGNMVRRTHVEKKPPGHICGHAPKHVWSLLPKLQTCSSINPQDSGVCSKVKMTLKTLCLLVNLRSLTKTYFLMNKCRLMTLLNQAMLMLHYSLFRKYNMYFRNILKRIRVLASVHYPCNA